jgi:hypothetical protein
MGGLRTRQMRAVVPSIVHIMTKMSRQPLFIVAKAKILSVGKIFLTGSLLKTGKTHLKKVAIIIAH